MGYKDAIEVAREILERDTSSTSESTDTLAEEILEELKLEEAKSKAKEGHAEDDDSEEDEDEEEVEEGKMPPWLDKNKKDKDRTLLCEPEAQIGATDCDARKHRTQQDAKTERNNKPDHEADADDPLVGCPVGVVVAIVSH